MPPAPSEPPSEPATAGVRRDARFVDAATALRAIPDGARVYLSPFCGTPLQLLAALDEQRERWSSLELVGGFLLEEIAPLRHPGDPFRFTSWQMSGPWRPAVEAGVLDVIPARYSQSGALFSRGGHYAVDVALVQVSPPGPDGRLSLGTSVGSALDVVLSAPLVIAQVNREMPYTYGAGELPPEAFDMLVELDGPLPELARPTPGARDHAIAEHVVALVPDGSTLQIGLGAIPEAVVAGLHARAELGVHSGQINDSIVDLAEQGVLTNSRKAFDEGVSVTAEVIGTRRLFDWVDRNPLVRLAPASYTHGLSVLSRCSLLRAVNSAVQVALDGSINAESVGGRLISGAGGQPDFAEAALWAEDAISFVAMPSTAAGGRVSRIVSSLDEGAVVAVARHTSDRVVTEYGVADLRGLPLSLRADALRAIADPRFRDELA